MFASQIITCCNNCGCDNKVTVIQLEYYLHYSSPISPNSYSGLSYSLNIGSLKAENSLNWLV